MDVLTKEYEIAFVVKDEMAASAFLKLLHQHGAEIFAEGPLQPLKAAYRIKKEQDVFFGYVHVRMAPEHVKQLTNDLNVNSSVLRFLIITPPFAKISKPIHSMTERVSHVREVGVSVPREVSLAPKMAMPLSNEELEKKINEISQ